MRLRTRRRVCLRPSHDWSRESIQKGIPVPRKCLDRRPALLQSPAELSVERLTLDVFVVRNCAQSRQPFIDSRKRFSRLVHSFEGKVERHSIMDAQERVTQFAAGVAFREHIRDSVKIPQRKAT